MIFTLMITDLINRQGGNKVYHKIPKNSDTRKIAVINLKLEQYHFTTEYM